MTSPRAERAYLGPDHILQAMTGPRSMITGVRGELGASHGKIVVMRDRVIMNGRNYRMTEAMRKVLAQVVDAAEPAFGFSICESTGLGPGVVYPVLEKLMNAGLIHDEWESPAPDERPRRRFYHPAYGPSWYRSNRLLPEAPA